jgi:hypothetical protein
VQAAPAARADATAFVKASGADPAAVRVVASTEGAPRPMYDIRGGDQYVINGNTLCSVGFSVNGGFVTAGHCGGVGSPTLGFNNVSQGTFAGSSFPGNDYAWVRTNSNWTPQPWVNNYAGGNVTVAGSQDAVIGASVCRSGRTTGWRCGVIQARDVSVSYPQGVVTGLTRSNACAEGGDSGGSWISGNQAQGVTSGGSGNCTSGGTMYFQPVNEILGAFGLSLVTSGGGGGGGGNSQLLTGQRLARGQERVSANGRFRLAFQADANLVIYDNGAAIWSTNTWNVADALKPTHLDMQADGNLVLYNDGNQAAWASGSWGSGRVNPYLDMQDDGNLVIYHNGRSAIWASGTSR